MKRYIFVLLILLLLIKPVSAWQIEQNNTNLNGTVRFSNITYYNNFSYPLILNIYANPNYGLFINNTLLRGSSFFVFVPVNGSYRLNNTGSVPSLNYWYEWKTIETEDTMTNELLTIITISMLFIIIYILYKEIVR